MSKQTKDQNQNLTWDFKIRLTVAQIFLSKLLEVHYSPNWLFLYSHHLLP